MTKPDITFRNEDADSGEEKKGLFENVVVLNGRATVLHFLCNDQNLILNKLFILNLTVQGINCCVVKLQPFILFLGRKHY